jgi:hypothetical protein
MLVLGSCKAILDVIFDDSKWDPHEAQERIACAVWFVFRFNKRTTEQTRGSLQSLIVHLRAQLSEWAQSAPIFRQTENASGTTRSPPPSGVRHRIPKDSSDEWRSRAHP